MAALYVDVDDCAVREPHTIGQETAAKCLAYARQEVERLRLAKLVADQNL